MEVTQPGAYTAQIVVNTNTPTRVNPRHDHDERDASEELGEGRGDGDGRRLQGHDRSACRACRSRRMATRYSFSLMTDQDGKYAYWGPESATRTR